MGGRRRVRWIRKRLLPPFGVRFLGVKFDESKKCFRVHRIHDLSMTRRVLSPVRSRISDGRTTSRHTRTVKRLAFHPPPTTCANHIRFLWTPNPLNCSADQELGMSILPKFRASTNRQRPEHTCPIHNVACPSKLPPTMPSSVSGGEFHPSLDFSVSQLLPAARK